MCSTFTINSLLQNALLVTNFSDQKLLVTTMTNLDINLQSKNYWLLYYE